MYPKRKTPCDTPALLGLADLVTNDFVPADLRPHAGLCHGACICFPPKLLSHDVSNARYYHIDDVLSMSAHMWILNNYLWIYYSVTYPGTRWRTGNALVCLRWSQRSIPASTDSTTRDQEDEKVIFKSQNDCADLRAVRAGQRSSQ